MKEKIRLTQMVTTAGCSAKMFPFLLSEVLKDIDWPVNENVLVGLSGKDDAGVYKLNDEISLIQTTDFFTPIVDDPYTFGLIAATNALSDIYAMGGDPVSALNITAFPQKEDILILKEILRGGADKVREAGAVIIGGHTIDIPTILYGLAVTGTIYGNFISSNSNSKPRDILILTKPLGTGILSNVLKFGSLNESSYKMLVNSMTQLNKDASVIMRKYKVNSCTDITGFGLSGHSMQMAKESSVVFHINVNKLPVLTGVMEGIKNNFLTRGDKSNRTYTKEFTKNKGSIDSALEHLLFDPQTSGGLLMSADEKSSNALLNELKENGYENAQIIGTVLTPDKDNPPGTLIFEFE